MMHGSMNGASAMEPQLNVAAMVDIVKDLVAGDRFRQQDGAWLRKRAAEAHLNRHEYAALETLRVRLCELGPALLNAVVTTTWRS
jgi:hypothetical protein